MNIKEVLALHFGFENPQVEALVGYANTNHKVVMGSKAYVFKAYPFSPKRYSILAAENEVLRHLATEKQRTTPSPVPFLDGHYIKTVDIDGEKCVCRLLTFLEGTFLGNTQPTEAVAKQLGSFLAKIDQKIKPIYSDALSARSSPWDLEHFRLNQKYVRYIPDAQNRSLVHYFFQRFSRNVQPCFPLLRKQIIHNDANEWNILVDKLGVSGLIDFGDLTYAPLINEVAIAMTYMAYDKDNPLEWATLVLIGYHQITPILENEIELLYDLIAARLCTSICNSAYAKHQQPENTYTTISEEYTLPMLKRWLILNPIKVINEFKLALGFQPAKMPTVEKEIEQRHKHISPMLSLSYTTPIVMQGSAFQYMFDKSGHTFLDAYNNIPHVGHCHPAVVEAAQLQMGRLNTNTRYLFDQLAEYAEKLVGKCPKPLNKVFFVNSGSAAADLAIRMAKKHTQRNHLVVMEHGYHGNTQQSIVVSDYKFSHPRGEGQAPNIIKVPLPDTYRGEFRDVNAGKQYALNVAKQLEEEDDIAAFISESIVGCGGQVPLASGYLQEVFKTIRSKGGLCIADEVQTGFGRLGTHFWAFESHRVVPDILILGKPMGNGHPIGAVICTDEVAASFEKGVEFFSSFGGNPVSCAVGMAVLEVIEKEGLQEHALSVGQYYKGQLMALQEKHPVIGDVRGSGLFLGIDVVHPDTSDTHHRLAQKIKNTLRDHHILISTDGPDDSILKTKPPLCFNTNNVDTVVQAIECILSDSAKNDYQ